MSEKKNLPEKKEKPALPVDTDHSFVNEMADALNPVKGLNIALIDPYKKYSPDMNIILLGKSENKFGIIPRRFKILRTEGDNLVLQPYDEMGSTEARQELAEFIVQLHEKDIRTQAVEVVKEALMRKPLKVLKKLKIQSEQGKKSKLRTSMGCVSFEVGDESVTL